MKKGTWGFYLLYCFLCGAVLLVSSCDKISFHRPEKVKGTVVSLDAAKKEIVMKDAATGTQRTITAQNADQLALLKPGMEIKAKIKRGTTIAEKIVPRAQKKAGTAGRQKDDEE